MKIDTPKSGAVQIGRMLAKLTWFSGFAPKWDARYKLAQSYVDSEVVRLSEPYTPFATGNLSRSGGRGTIIGSGEVVWNAPYARYLYYGKLMVGKAPKNLTDVNLTYTGGPKRGAFWFERMKRDHGRKILNGAWTVLRGGP